MAAKYILMLPAEYIAQQDADRQPLLTAIHEVIIANDPGIAPVIEKMMGKEMILYKTHGGKGTMKYGLASVKKHMSLHALPMYMSPKIYERYTGLLKSAKFQKGCINFNSASEVPLSVIEQFIVDCAAVDMEKQLNDYRASKK